MPGPSGHPVWHIVHEVLRAYARRRATPARARALRAAALVALLAGVLSTASSAAAAPLIENEPEAKLTAGSQSVNGNRFGMSVALSADGRTALVGAPHALGLAGGAWIFSRSLDGWEPPGVELAGPSGSELGACIPDGAGGEPEEEGTTEEAGECRFGRSVALSADGDTAVVGAPLVADHEGAVWVFSRGEGGWTREAVLSDPAGERANRFGGAVAVSGDGRTVVVGAPGDNYSRGAAWIFTLSEGGWQASGELTGEGESGQGMFGQSVAISAGGQVALVGAPADSAERGWRGCTHAAPPVVGAGARRSARARKRARASASSVALSARRVERRSSALVTATKNAVPRGRSRRAWRGWGRTGGHPRLGGSRRRIRLQRGAVGERRRRADQPRPATPPITALRGRSHVGSTASALHSSSPAPYGRVRLPHDRASRSPATLTGAVGGHRDTQ